MVRILLENIHVRFPVLHTAHRSLKKTLIANATGGLVMREADTAPIVYALSGLTMSLEIGDRVGLIGPNGAGKTTLLRVLGGIYEPDEGSVIVEGRIATLLNVTLGFNSDLSGRENLKLRGLYMGIKRKDMAACEQEIAEFTELGDYFDLPVRTYSSGMQLRLALGLAMAVQPDILLMDEWILAGDIHFREKAKARVDAFVDSAHILVLASHSTEIIRKWCNKALYLNAGNVLAFGPVEEVLKAYEG